MLVQKFYVVFEVSSTVGFIQIIEITLNQLVVNGKETFVSRNPARNSKERNKNTAIHREKKTQFQRVLIELA